MRLASGLTGEAEQEKTVNLCLESRKFFKIQVKSLWQGSHVKGAGCFIVLRPWRLQFTAPEADLVVDSEV